MKPRFFMMLLMLISMMLFCASCMTPDKATGYLSAHPKLAAGYCAAQFPVKESISFQTSTDSAQYYQTLGELSWFADSLLDAARRKSDSANDYKRQLVEAQYGLSYYKGLPVDTSNPRIYRFDTAAYKRAVMAKLKASIKPCHDTTITKTVVDNAKVEFQRQRADESEKKVLKEVDAKDKWKKIALISLAVNLVFVVGIIIKIVK